MLKNLFDIVSVIRDVITDNSDAGSIKTGSVTMRLREKKSISRMAMDAIADFVVLVDDQCTLDEGMLIARALEKRFASFLLIAMSMDPTVHLGHSGNLTDYVKQFHQNMDTEPDFDAKFSLENATVESIATLAESLGKEYEVFATEQTAAIMHTIYENVSSQLANTECARLNFFVEETLNPKVVDGCTRKTKVVQEALGDRREPIINTEFKKANDMVPTLLHIVVNGRRGKGRNASDNTYDFAIGVKASLHPVSQSAIVLNLVKGLKNDDGFFRFMRWTTGEIKFFKDFLLMVDQLKLDAATMSNNSGNRYFNMGRRRKELASIKNRFSKSNLMPNMTLVVTTDCLQKIKDEYGYDITMEGGSSQLALVKKLMNNYFMLGFVIVDQGLNRVHLLIDGDANFSTFTYAGLEKEGQQNDKQFKEMMKMLGRSV